MANRSNESRNSQRMVLSKGDKRADPWAMLALAVIERAARDFRMGPRLGKDHYLSAVYFFEGDFYQLCLDVVAACVPGFKPVDGLLPAGVDLRRKGVVNRTPAAEKPAQADFFGNGVPNMEHNAPKSA